MKSSCPGVEDNQVKEELQESPAGEKYTSMPEEQREDCQTEECNPDDEKDDVDADENIETSKLVKYEFLPASVKRRVRALRGIQLKMTNINENYFKELFKLEIQHDKIRQELFEKRLDITSGAYEPTSVECDQAPDDKQKNQTKIEKINSPIYDEDVKGVPDFWLTVCKNSSIIYEVVHENDEKLLSHLQDIKLKLCYSPPGYTLEFHFSENESFTNKVLTKYYELSCKPDENYPFGFSGMEEISCKGCNIDWKEGKNITFETIKRLKSMRKVAHYVDSFFNFFDPPAVPEKDSVLEEISREVRDEDFELGKFFKDKIIPKAILYYTNEISDGRDDDDYEEKESDDDKENDEEEKNKDNDEDGENEDKEKLEQKKKDT